MIGVGDLFSKLSRRGAWAAASLGCVLLAALALGLSLISCIKNDLPYPRIPQYITELVAEGESQPAVLDTVALTATVTLAEDVDPAKVRFERFAVTEGAVADPDLLDGSWDLRYPMVINVERWQNYQWTLIASQPIERYINVSGQIGSSVIDEVGHRVILRFPEGTDLAHLQLTALKLGPAGVSTLQPALVPGALDLSRPLRVAVTAWGRTEDWTIYAELTEMTVQTVRADAWSCVIWAYGQCLESQLGSFRYRPASAPDSDWITLPDEAVTNKDGNFSACISGLQPMTEYVVQAFAGEDLANEVRVTTESTMDLPDGSFDQWWLDGKIWCPWNQGGVQFWDTGNTGASTLGPSNVVPSDDTPSGSGQSAKLETKFVGLGSIGKLAAGSIYSGKFKKVDGTNGILDFGRPWTLRPTRLRGYMKYHTAPINYASTEYKSIMGEPDTCAIYVALTDWSAPLEVRTNPKTRQLFDSSSPSVIAYGEINLGHDTDGWQEFVIELDYRSTSRIPTYIQITAAASKYGDFFTGGAGAVLYVDQFSLEYDY